MHTAKGAFLEKKEGDGWEKLYFKVEQGQLTWRKEPRAKLLNALNLRGADIERVALTNGKLNSFVVSCLNWQEPIVLCAQSDRDREAWLKVLTSNGAFADFQTDLEDGSTNPSDAILAQTVLPEELELVLSEVEAILANLPAAEGLSLEEESLFTRRLQYLFQDTIKASLGVEAPQSMSDWHLDLLGAVDRSYWPVVQSVVNRNLDAAVAACSSLQPDVLAKVTEALCELCELCNQSLFFIRFLIQKEVADTTSFPDLFRSNGLASKVLAYYCKLFGTRFLHEVLMSPVRLVIADAGGGSRGGSVSFELDPHKAAQPRLGSAGGSNSFISRGPSPLTTSGSKSGVEVVDNTESAAGGTVKPGLTRSPTSPNGIKTKPIGPPSALTRGSLNMGSSSTRPVSPHRGGGRSNSLSSIRQALAAATGRGSSNAASAASSTSSNSASSSSSTAGAGSTATAQSTQSSSATSNSTSSSSKPATSTQSQAQGSGSGSGSNRTVDHPLAALSSASFIKSAANIVSASVSATTASSNNSSNSSSTSSSNNNNSSTSSNNSTGRGRSRLTIGSAGDRDRSVNSGGDGDPLSQSQSLDSVPLKSTGSRTSEMLRQYEDEEGNKDGEEGDADGDLLKELERTLPQINPEQFKELAIKKLNPTHEEEFQELLLQNCCELEQSTRLCLTQIFAALNTAPMKLRILAHYVQEAVERKFPNQSTTAVSGLIFLRFICPALLNPTSWIVDVEVNEGARRNLLLVAKIIQNLANGRHFGKKEKYMVPLNAFIEQWLPQMRNFANSFANPPDGSGVRWEVRPLASRALRDKAKSMELKGQFELLLRLFVGPPLDAPPSSSTSTSTSTALSRASKHGFSYTASATAKMDPEAQAQYRNVLARGWQTDEARSCPVCHQSLATDNPNQLLRFHCRRCGMMYCQRCASHRAPLPALGYFSPVRVCIPCASAVSQDAGKAPLKA